MPIVLLFIGCLLLAAAVNGSTHDLGRQLKKDFTGDHSYLYWLAAVFIIGFVGYVPAAQKASRYFLTLLVLSMTLANGRGVFDRLTAALRGTAAAAPAPGATAAPAASVPAAPGAPAARSNAPAPISSNLNQAINMAGLLAGAM